MNKKIAYILFMSVFLVFTGANCLAGVTQDAKIMVVMSYSTKNISEIDIKFGIDEVLADSNLKYFYMDTKKKPQNGALMARKAYELFKNFKPDVLITVDDNAQAQFVVPYIIGSEKTPVVFCGVNDSAEKYKYPSSQVTGILEKKHYLQTINFARLIEPKLKNIAVIYKNNASNQANLAQINKEQGLYGVNIVDKVAVTNKNELEASLLTLQRKADALLVFNLSGIVDENGIEMNRDQTIKVVNDRWHKLTLAASKSEISSGLLCAVAKVNTEQGEVAARIAVKILNGTPVSAIPITENRDGQRLINVTTARRVGIKLKPIVLLGTQLLQ